MKFFYDGKEMKLTEPTEEVATFYGRMIEHDYTTKEVVNRNFMKDWRKVMTEKEKSIIRDISLCEFSQINAHFKKMSEERKGRSKEEKKAEKERNDAIQEEYGFCTIDGHREKIGNFRIEPPGLFRGRHCLLYAVIGVEAVEMWDHRARVILGLIGVHKGLAGWVQFKTDRGQR